MLTSSPPKKTLTLRSFNQLLDGIACEDDARNTARGILWLLLLNGGEKMPEFPCIAAEIKVGWR